ncbi:hypothetical protein DPV78_008640 [Talaromyces pinophilus]|nr:hypothetical protein DPV78_008640 [Talaromyces pinophilus]
MAGVTVYTGSTQSQKAEYDDVFDRESHIDKTAEGSITDKNSKSEGKAGLYEMIRPLHRLALPSSVSIHSKKWRRSRRKSWYSIDFPFPDVGAPPGIYLIACLSALADSDAITYSLVG